MSEENATNVAPADESVDNESVETEETQEVAPVDENALKDWNPDQAMEKIRKQNAELKNLRGRVKAAEAATGELGQVKATNEELQQTTAQLQAQLLKYEIGLELGLPAALVSRLNGNTKEELLADAEALVGMFQPPKQVPTDRPTELTGGGGSRPNVPKRSNSDLFSEVLDQMFGSQ